MNWKISTIFIMVLVAIVLLGFKHPMHISVSEINYSKSSNTLEISQKIFLDDLELAFSKNDIYPNKIGDSLTKDNQEAIKKYLKKKIRFIIDDSVYTFSYVGAEIEEDALWCYYEIKNVNSFQRLEILNSVLFDVYEDQKNLVNIEINEKTTTLIFHKQNPKQVLFIN